MTALAEMSRGPLDNSVLINAKDEKGNEEREGAKKGVLVNPEGSAKIVPAATKANDADLSA